MGSEIVWKFSGNQNVTSRVVFSPLHICFGAVNQFSCFSPWSTFFRHHNLRWPKNTTNVLLKKEVGAVSGNPDFGKQIPLGKELPIIILVGGATC